MAVVRTDVKYCLASDQWFVSCKFLCKDINKLYESNKVTTKSECFLAEESMSRMSYKENNRSFQSDRGMPQRVVAWCVPSLLLFFKEQLQFQFVTDAGPRIAFHPTAARFAFFVQHAQGNAQRRLSANDSSPSSQKAALICSVFLCVILFPHLSRLLSITS